jgi:hypothetical protein
MSAYWQDRLDRFRNDGSCEREILDALDGLGRGDEPGGFKLVPVEPTEEMRLAGVKTDLMQDRLTIQDYEYHACVYRAMLAAAPKPPEPKP